MELNTTEEQRDEIYKKMFDGVMPRRTVVVGLILDIETLRELRDYWKHECEQRDKRIACLTEEKANLLGALKESRSPAKGYSAYHAMCNRDSDTLYLGE